MDLFQLGFYCGICSMAFCYFLVYGPHAIAIGAAMFVLFLAKQADLEMKS